MSEIKLHINNGNGYLRAISQGFPGFCAVKYMWGFENRGVPTPEESLIFTKMFIEDNIPGSVLIIADRKDSGMHKYITPHLPDRFDAINCHGYNVKCVVVRGKPYKNLNTGNMVQEVRIEMTRIPHPRKPKEASP